MYLVCANEEWNHHLKPVPYLKLKISSVPYVIEITFGDIGTKI